MCLIIEKPAGTTVPLWIIESAAEYNSDGAGLMVNGTYEKWLTIKPRSIKKKVDALQDELVALHFRFATHGAVDHRNAHPHQLENGFLLMHNGVLSSFGKSATVGESDTVNFINEVVNPAIAENDPDTETLAQIILDNGSGNRFALMDSRGDMWRIGNWIEYEGLRFSNKAMWDYPYFSGFEGYGKSAKYDDSYWQDAADYADDAGYENGVLGELIREELVTYSDRVTINHDTVSSGDLWLVDSVYAGEMTPDEFITLCNAQTAASLYRELVRSDSSPRPVHNGAW
jgi:hypothetical protein